MIFRPILPCALLAAILVPHVQADEPILLEAEEFTPQSPGWSRMKFGSNYFAGTFANCFLSRKGYLQAVNDAPAATAVRTVTIPSDGKYLALVRYESVYRFETQFRLTIEQGGKLLLDRRYGARANPKIWAFRKGIVPEVVWDWGAVENIVWEGHDAFVELRAGPATLTLHAGPQPQPGANRNVDLVMLTNDLKEVETRLAKENYLPLDGLLTQRGDLYCRVSAPKDGPAVTVTLPPGVEHSPYWVHLRRWKPITFTAPPGTVSDWQEVGGLLDTLSDGQWTISLRGTGDLEFATVDASGNKVPLRKFSNVSGSLTLAYPADVRFGGTLRTDLEILRDLTTALEQVAVVGSAPKRVLIYGLTFSEKPGDEEYNQWVRRFVKASGASALSTGPRSEMPTDPPRRGYIDVRSIPTDKLEAYCLDLVKQGKAEHIATVSMGDEIGLDAPPADAHEAFRAWLREQKLTPAALDASFGEDWSKVKYSASKETAKTQPGVYYWSRIFAYRWGTARLKERTDILRKYLPNAATGANFSPHHGVAYLGETYHWISVFRDQGMTMPWGEDYVWQLPVGSPQVSLLMIDMFRAAIKDRPEALIHYYVMPHFPGNTPNAWRRQFYGALAHGAKVLNLFEFRPVQAAYTENHVTGTAMYAEVRKSLHELGGFEDLIQDGRVAPAKVALWCSETSDVHHSQDQPFGVGKRSLYLALRRTQVPLDIVVEGDDLNPYRVLIVTDRHVSRRAATALSEWVKNGGTLVLTAGAGEFDELLRPNKELTELAGGQWAELRIDTDLKWEKQDLPYAKPQGIITTPFGKLSAFGAFAAIRPTDAVVIGQAEGNTCGLAKVTRGRGTVYSLGFLPGLTWLHPALPKRPIDRGTTDESFGHFLPKDCDPITERLLNEILKDVPRPVTASHAWVESTMIESRHGRLIPLVNWSNEPIRNLTVTIPGDSPARIIRASGLPLTVAKDGDRYRVTLDLSVADALICR